MENREMHRLQKLYILETHRYLECLKEGVSTEVLKEQKDKIKELSRIMDETKFLGADPSGSPLRRHAAPDQ